MGKNTAGHLPSADSFRVTGRATPDVAALGEDYATIWSKCQNDEGQCDPAPAAVFPGGGTSASAPTFAGIVSLLNLARVGVGLPPMGYINPWLYQHPEAFTDITVGSGGINRAGQPVEAGF